MKKKYFELRIIFCCDEEVAGKINDEVMEKRCNFLGDGVAHCFEINQSDLATIEIITLTPIEVKDAESPSSN